LARSIKILSPIGVIVAVLGGIYLGVTTPTEASAVGALCALILSIAQRELTWRKLWKAALSTVQVTSYILLIVASASVVSFVMQYLRIPEALTEYVVKLNLSKYVVITSFVALYFILGMLIDPISMMVMTVPTLLPTVIQMGFDPIWFAVVVTMMCEIGNITPPVGMNLFVVQGVCNASLAEVSIGSAPFVLALLIDVAIITAYPIIATWLPSIM
jgi:tripartite ATP-independent transporter DctM subunit